jgi:hypothetical protein
MRIRGGNERPFAAYVALSTGDFTINLAVDDLDAILASGRRPAGALARRRGVLAIFIWLTNPRR